MKLKLFKTAIILLIILFALGIGVEMVYCTDMRMIEGGFKDYSISISEYGNVFGYYAGADTKKKVERVSRKLTEWARKNNAAILVSEQTGWGSAVCDCSGGFMDLLVNAGVPEGSQPLDENTVGVYVSDESTFRDVYVVDGIFMPDEFGLPVLGYFDESKMPDRLRQPFYYSLSEMKKPEQEVFTDSSEDIEALKEYLLKENEGMVINSSHKYNRLWEFVSGTLSDLGEFRSQSSILTPVFTLAICAAFSGVMLFRELGESLRIRHLFGMSFSRIILATVVITAAIAISAALILRGSMQSFSLVASLKDWEKDFILELFLAVVLPTAVITDLIGLVMTKKSIRGGIRNERDKAGTA